ncbi:MAG TPA: 2Fe-2S iron-sulfur cluster-binding protein [Saprospiraceae bacterium]|nr:2Fe-2S iron-sulfur cluster-binding protein [Saprospiraceae bacterium]
MEEKDIEITVIDREGEPHLITIPNGMGFSLMEICKAEGLDVLGTCGGIALCATCHVYIDSSTPLNTPSVDEEMMLDQVNHYKPISRLGCQIKVDAACDGLIARLAPE